MSARANVSLYLIHVRCHSFFCRFLVILMCALIVVMISSILVLYSFVRFLQENRSVNNFFIEFVADVAHFDFRISSERVLTFLRSLISLNLFAIAVQNFLT